TGQPGGQSGTAGAHALESGWGAPVGERVLEHGRDFDVCVLAIPIGALPPLVRELTLPSSPHHDPRWRAMVDGVSLIETVSAQLWLDRPAAELFDGPPRGLLTGFAHPQASFGELSHLIASERWESPPPQLALYLTGALLAGARLPEGGPELLHRAERRSAWWREQFELWLATHYRDLFPRGPSSYEALLELLRVPASAEPAHGADRLAAQWFDIARYPSDLYVLSRPGEMRLRMAPHESGVRFMLLAGDWTRTDLGCGCVEAATQSGMLAARVLSGEPVYLWRTGF
ncbi:MAG: hypothetical protein IAG13_28225, partial [Deltaproteobacteria bacterium]|nr:hypothetical protein [Nannocystaceae bacterium]